MSDNQDSRRKFLQLLGLSAGATLVSTTGIAGFVDTETIYKLNPEQQEFMMRYGQWMDEFIEVIRVQKSEPDNLKNNHMMISLTERAEEIQPELAKFMKDETFSMIYKVSIERMSKEI